MKLVPPLFVYFRLFGFVSTTGEAGDTSMLSLEVGVGPMLFEAGATSLSLVVEVLLQSSLSLFESLLPWRRRRPVAKASPG
jgi:hypothetical protein